VSPSRAPQGKVRCITSPQSQPPLHNPWYLACVPFCNTGPYSLVSPPPTCAVQKEAGKMASAPPDAGIQVSPMYIDIYMCEHACVPYIIIVCTHIFIGACIHAVRYRHACYMHTYAYLLVWVHAHVFAYTRISRTTALFCCMAWQYFGSCGAVVDSRCPVVHQLAVSGCMSHVAYPPPCSYAVLL
jgi:hypothetical protein